MSINLKKTYMKYSVSWFKLLRRSPRLYYIYSAASRRRLAIFADPFSRRIIPGYTLIFCLHALNCVFTSIHAFAARTIRRVVSCLPASLCSQLQQSAGCGQRRGARDADASVPTPLLTPTLTLTTAIVCTVPQVNADYTSRSGSDVFQKFVSL